MNFCTNNNIDPISILSNIDPISILSNIDPRVYGNIKMSPKRTGSYYKIHKRKKQIFVLERDNGADFTSPC